MGRRECGGPDLRAIATFNTAEVSGRVRADVLLLAGRDDHYVPITQLHTQLAALTDTRSCTARVFTQAEQASSHCQVGNLGLAVQVILDWLGGLDRRDAALQGQTPGGNSGRAG